MVGHPAGKGQEEGGRDGIQEIRWLFPLESSALQTCSFFLNKAGEASAGWAVGCHPRGQLAFQTPLPPGASFSAEADNTLRLESDPVSNQAQLLFDCVTSGNSLSSSVKWGEDSPRSLC